MSYCSAVGGRGGVDWSRIVGWLFWLDFSCCVVGDWWVAFCLLIAACGTLRLFDVPGEICFGILGRGP